MECLAGLKHLKDLPLNDLDLSYCPKITDAGLKHLKGLKQLNTLNLMRCDKITDEGLEHLRGLPLKKLNLFGCNLITSEGLFSFKIQCFGVEILGR